MFTGGFFVNTVGDYIISGNATFLGDGGISCSIYSKIGRISKLQLPT
ncbi:hypothetical protein BPJM79_20628 [Bacillus pumilus]|jgi:hypothetical protein